MLVWISTLAISSAGALATLAPAKVPSARLDSAGATHVVLVGLCTARSASPALAPPPPPPLPLSPHAPVVGDWRPVPVVKGDAVESATESRDSSSVGGRPASAPASV